MHVILLEDHPLVATAVSEHLRASLDRCDVVYAGARLEDALCESESADVAVVDLDLGDGRTPSEVVGALRAQGVPVIVMSAHDQPGQVQAAVSAGAFAYIPKRSIVDQLVDAMSALRDGHDYITADFAAALVPDSATTIVLDPSAQRALVLFAAGMPMPAIASRLGVDIAQVQHLLHAAVAAYRH